MRIAHIASFQGNIGDILNHYNFYESILSELDVDTIKKYELRDFYFNAKARRSFDALFAQELNQYDLVVMGGGGFFDIRWENSSTGTTLDLPRVFLDALKVKVLVNAMGYHEYPGETTDVLSEKFYSFMSDILKRENWRITWRNDGSVQRLTRRYGDRLGEVNKVPDNAFYGGLSGLKDLKQRT